MLRAQTIKTSALIADPRISRRLSAAPSSSSEPSQLSSFEPQLTLRVPSRKRRLNKPTPNEQPPNSHTMYVSRLRGVAAVATSSLPRRAALSTTTRQFKGEVAAPSPPPAATTSTTASTQTTVPTTKGPAPTAVAQAPNRADIWSRSQRPRAEAMTGPRFEQTDFELQVRFSDALPAGYFAPNCM